jgi:hypothetical protein
MWDAMTETPINPLALLAERARAEPFFLASALAIHRERFGITEAEQRRHLGVRAEDWAMLCLCRMPEADEHLQVLCTRFGCDAERLGRALRAGE